MQKLIWKAIFTVAIIASITSKLHADSGALKYTISVHEFRNEAGWSGRWDLGQGFATIMTDLLNHSGKFIVLGDREMRGAAMAEQDFAASGRTAQGRRTPQTGRMTPAQLLVRGSITHVQETAGGSGGVSIRGIRVGGGGGRAEINMTVYLVDTTTGQVVASKSVTGSSGRRGLGLGYYGSELGGLTGNLEGFTSDNVGKASEAAVEEAIKFLSEQLGKIQWYGTVMAVTGDRVIINRGTREGVSKGMRFSVGEIEELIDPDTGELLHSEMKAIAELEAADVRERITYCTIVSGEGIAKDMTVFAKTE
jgi:curli biogenesis system outer membrane secretion channel CsgG